MRNHEERAKHQPERKLSILPKLGIAIQITLGPIRLGSVGYSTVLMALPSWQHRWQQWTHRQKEKRKIFQCKVTWKKKKLGKEVLHRKINRSNKTEAKLNWSPWHPEPKSGCSLPLPSSTLYWRSQIWMWLAKRTSCSSLIPYTKCHSEVYMREKVPNFTIMLLRKHLMDKTQRLWSWRKMCSTAWKLGTFGQRAEKGSIHREGKPWKNT